MLGQPPYSHFSHSVFVRIKWREGYLMSALREMTLLFWQGSTNTKEKGKACLPIWSTLPSHFKTDSTIRHKVLLIGMGMTLGLNVIWWCPLQHPHGLCSKASPQRGCSYLSAICTHWKPCKIPQIKSTPLNRNLGWFCNGIHTLLLG